MMSQLRRTMVPPGYFHVVYDDTSIQPVEIPISEFKGVGYGEILTDDGTNNSMRSDGQSGYDFPSPGNTVRIVADTYVYVCNVRLVCGFAVRRWQTMWRARCSTSSVFAGRI